MGVSPAARTPSEADVALLWAASSIAPDLEHVASAATGADIGYVLATAAAHRVAPLVLRSLGRAGIEVHPSLTWAVTRSKAWEAHAKLALPAAAAAALEPLHEAGLTPLVLKGLGLIDRYPAPGLRPMDDIDLLLPKPMASRAVPVLERAGWVRVRHPHRNPGYDFVFRHPAVPGVPLELHYQIARWGERPRGLDASDLWTARVPREVFGHPAWSLPPELEVLTLVAHAAKPFHVFNRVSWFADVAVVSSAQGFDWETLDRLTRTARRRIATGVALTVAARLGAPVPPPLLEIPPVETREGTLDDLLDRGRPFSSQPRPRWLAYILVDDVAGKIRLAATDLVRPTGQTPRLRIARDLVRMAVRGTPALIRARRRARIVD